MALLSFLRNLRNQNKMKKLRYLVNANHVLLRQKCSSTCTNQRCGISEPKKLDLKDEIENYINNHKYTLIAATADVCKQKFQEHLIGNTLGESFTSSSSIWQFPWKRTEKDKPFIYENSENIFARGYDALEDYLHGEKVDHQMCAAFTALERFYTNKELHERNLAQLNSMNLTKTETASLITSHLLSQLLFNPANHIIDSNFSEGPPYDCRAPVQYGYTNFGSTRLFHGNADITLFPTTEDMFLDSQTDAAVFHIGEPEESPDANRLHPKWNTVDYDDNDEEEKICDANNSENFNDSDINQVCKQAISLTMWKHKQRILAYSGNKDYGSSMVPICGINRHKYMVVLYNAQHDYLLKMQKKDFLKVFDKDKLEFSTIINLWMLIHHNLFCTEPSDNAIQILKGAGGLLQRLGEDTFKEVVITSKFYYDTEPSGDEFEVDMENDSIPASGTGRLRKFQKINQEQ
ncbi:uncharacterized protein LOC127704338 [Mytilus californianus]|uniref:uncharacterized protein LOC127704338 n=1 Tax=Mytilus californianus TaxID=6549 RepID=UPI002246C50F|nr:uncharacterized protein LOC127704338 [Mytilus californianus]